MICLQLSHRSGVIDFMLTLALGVALGAATLVVTNEVIKGDDKETARNAQNLPHDQKQKLLLDSAKNFFQARKEYEDAVRNSSDDISVKRENLMRAKAVYERAVVINTPSPVPAGTTQTAQNTNVPASNPQVESGRRNPFQETVVIPRNINIPTNISITVSTNGGQPVTTNITVPAAGATNSTPPAANVPSNVPPATTSTTSTTPANAPSNVTGNSAKIDNNTRSIASTIINLPKLGFEYIKVKAGDTLSGICKRYYGVGGLWQHIVKYQIPSIAANPHLIFPGQLIALPRSIFSSGDNTSHSVPVTNTNPGNHVIAGPGDESWQERFQKDYLISDHTFTNTNTMTVAQIQSFLQSKGSCLAKSYRNSSPAQMIYNAAKKYGINPQVLICRLQCEQSLISKKNATERELDWALGVGCYDDGTRNQSYKGLDKQIEYAAHTFRRWYDDGKSKGGSVSMTIDGQRVQVKNAASYSFYKYCPHFHGQKLFFDVWRTYRSRF
ncbi:MAG: LysM peptidoglycan-binding domain-containing protein [Candidatus Riflebacteria bacterium]|nr:LysM peptidoglycan-binding domain-containing protein [Candidatus Riflebacteria bacterium]